MKISKRSQYGLRAMVYLALAYREGRVCSIKEIAEKEKIPSDYLEKVVLRLAKNGLVGSKKGAHGGYSLAYSPKEIRVGEIIKVLEGSISPVRCVAREKKYRCPMKRSCKAVGVWEKIYSSLELTLNSITLSDLTK